MSASRDLPDRCDPPPPRRLWLQRAGAWAAMPVLPAWLAGCGGSEEPAPTAPPAPPPSATLLRVKAALQRAPLERSADPVSVTQGDENTAVSAFGPEAQVFPPLINPQAATLADVPQVWGHRRDVWTWREGPGAIVAGHTVYPIITRGCGLHFELDGSAFEILYVGANAKATLVADGRYMASRMIVTTLERGVEGVPLSYANRFVRFDFGSRARRRVSIYVWSDRGPCALAVPAGDTVRGWDRSDEASFLVMADSYGGGRGPDWDNGPFWEAAAQLGIPHLYNDHIGGTGYARVETNRQTADPANTFVARLEQALVVRPDVLLTAGSINDNTSRAAVDPDGNVIYATPAEALAGFEAAVKAYYTRLRAALPECVIVATGPWAPRQYTPTHPIAQAKADTILAALRAVGGNWVFIDNLNGGWLNSAGASAPRSGAWQTGAGNSAAPIHDGGNADLYISGDGTHLTMDGVAYIASRIAADLRAAILAL